MKNLKVMNRSNEYRHSRAVVAVALVVVALVDDLHQSRIRKVRHDVSEGYDDGTWLEKRTISGVGKL